MFTRRVDRAEFGALAAEILEKGNALRFRASGSSMSPFIRNGDVLVIQPIASQAVRRGDVVLCRAGDGRMLAHRVTRLFQQAGGTVLVTQGDALFYPDGSIPYDEVLGRVTTVERNGRRINITTGWQRGLALSWMRLAPLIRVTYLVLRTIYHWFKAS
jgi:signal peptidase I